MRPVAPLAQLDAGRITWSGEQVFRSTGYTWAMSILRKVAAIGIAKKVYDEARKPHNQAKIKAGVAKVQESRAKRRP